MFPTGGETAHAGFDGVGQDAKGVGQKELGDVVLVVGQVVVERGFQLDGGVFQLDEHKRNAVDIEQDIGPPEIQVAFYPELGHGEKPVLPLIIEIDHL